MHLQSLHALGFKRFTDLNVDGLSSSARLLILAGPNGSGKSSFFDALKAWHWYNGAPSSAYDVSYHQKLGDPVPVNGWTAGATAAMHEDILSLTPEGRKKLIYVRSAHRN